MPPFVPPIQQTRQGFLSDLSKHIKTGHLDQKDQECPICLVPYLGYSGPITNFSERAIILHDKCIVGEDCARHWLTRTTNDCPRCRLVLFRGRKRGDKLVPGQQPFNAGFENADNSDLLFDSALLIALRKSLKHHVLSIDTLTDIDLEHLLSTSGEAASNRRFLKLTRGMRFRASHFLADGVADNVNYATYDQQFTLSKITQKYYAVDAAKINATIWRWFIKAMKLPTANRRTPTFRIQDHAFAPKLVFETFEVTRQFDDFKVKLSYLTKELKKRLKRLGVPECWANEDSGLKALRHDLVAAVIRLVKGEGLVEQRRVEIDGVEGSWMEGVEVVDVPGVVW